MEDISATCWAIYTKTISAHTRAKFLHITIDEIPSRKYQDISITETAKTKA